MTKDIISKLRRHLDENPMDTECAVAYLLAEIRKVINDEKPSPWPLALWMHCSWALHVDLTQTNTTLDFLRRIDNYIVSRVSGFSGGSIDFVAEHRLSKDFVYLFGFRGELEQFLRLHNLPTRLCDDDSRWFRFVGAYSGVIEDGTLTTGKTDKLQAVEEVTFTKGRPLSEKHHVPFTIQWDIHLKDGRIARMELKNVPDAPLDSRMYCSGMTLIQPPASQLSGNG